VIESGLGKASVYTDFQGLAELRGEAGSRSPEVLEKVARQFESLFLQMMVKSMRDASLAEDDLMGGEGVELYRDMYDKQLATQMAGEGKGIGLADMLVRQLKGSQTQTPADDAAAGVFAVPARQAFTADRTEAPEADHAADPVPVAEKAAARESTRFDSPEEFVERLWPHAQRAARKLGVAPQALIAQAALETGWGKAVIQHGDGRSSHNLFNIKADGRWDGDRVAKSTLEYRDGVAQREKAWFRSYDSFAASFDDYAAFVQGNPRYGGALEAAGDPARYIDELHKAGYATDPAYARKIQDILGRDTLAAVKFSGSGTLS
jgi:flagellar protein FlgJ